MAHFFPFNRHSISLFKFYFILNKRNQQLPNLRHWVLNFYKIISSTRVIKINTKVFYIFLLLLISFMFVYSLFQIKKLTTMGLVLGSLCIRTCVPICIGVGWTGHVIIRLQGQNRLFVGPAAPGHIILVYWNTLGNVNIYAHSHTHVTHTWTRKDDLYTTRYNQSHRHTYGFRVVTVTRKQIRHFSEQHQIKWTFTDLCTDL